MMNFRRIGRIGAVAALSLLLASCADTPLSTMEPESPIARDLDTMLVWLLIACAVVFVIIQGLVIYMAKRFSVPAPDDDSQVYGDDDFPEQIHGNEKAEWAWTIGPAVVMAGLAVFSIFFVFKLDDVTAKEDRRIQSVTVVGQQWWWEFQYDLDGDGVADIVTANELVLPVDEEVQLHVTSRDVIHSFWVPALNGKRDAVPGSSAPWTIETSTVGRFLGECTEFCGLSHAYMEKFAVGVSEADWDLWAANQMSDAVAPAEGTDAHEGWKVFSNQCASCHVINGLTSRDGDTIDSIALYDGSNFGANRLIDKQTQVSGAAPNLTHLATRTSFAGGIFDLYQNPDSENYITVAEDGVLNRGALEAWIVNAPEEKANAWDSPSGQRGMTPFTALSAEDVDNLVAFLMSLD